MFCKDWIVLVFFIGLLVEFITDAFQLGRSRFFSNYWNYNYMAAMTAFFLHHVIWWACYGVLSGKVTSMVWENHVKDHAYATLLISECFRAVGILLAFIHNFSFIQANSITGPLLQAFTQMLGDVIKFFVCFFFLFLAFGVSFTKLYLQYDGARKTLFMGQRQANETNSLHLERLVQLTSL